MAIEIRTGAGRIVWGNPARSQIKKIQEGPDKGKPVLKDGQPINQWAFGVAFPKAEFIRDIWPAMQQEVASGFPHGVPGKFAWKYVDGDGVDSNGQPFNKREGYAGCYVLTISTEAFAPQIYRLMNNTYVQMKPEEIKTGDWVALALSIKLNIATDPRRTSSLYINPQGIDFVGHGQEIQNGPDPMALFKGQTYQLPPGASATPMAPLHNVGMPGTGGPSMPGQGPGMPMQPGPQQYAPQTGPGAPVGYPQPGPGYQPPPDPRFTGGPGQPQQPQYPNTNPGQPQGPGTPQYPPQGQPQGPGPGGYPPAYDFVHNAGQQTQPQYPPQGQPQMPGPGPQQYQQPGPGGYPPNMPGMPPNR